YQSGDERIHYFFNQLSREQRQSFELYLEYATKQAPFDELQKKWMELIQQSEKPENWVERLKRQEKEKEFRLQQMLRYINEENCRRKFILAYFGEKLSEKPQNCCDIDGAKAELLPKRKLFSKTEQLHWETILLNLFKKNMEH
ncbi:RecQ family zinc-binding domain-containing protein, partial [Enterococcus faecium]